MTNVTQADRLAYLSLNMLTPDDQLSVMAGNWDCTTGMQVLARHRHQALAQGRLDGVDAMREIILDEAYHKFNPNGEDWHVVDASDIRNLSAQTIANQIGEK